MSYARFSEGGVYVFLNTDGYLECCACSLEPDDFYCDTTKGMLEHLDEHEAAGHRIPDRTRSQLITDGSSNDRWMRLKASQGARA